MLDYEDFVSNGDPGYRWRMPTDEWDAISLNYTSGTTGNPKGVVYHHRGAALMCYANALATGMTRHPVYLWTLPMFHCNGWCFPWTISLVAGTHVCLRWVRAKAMYDAIVEHKVTNLSGAPIVMSTLLNAKAEERREITHRVAFNHAAAPPPEQVMAQMHDAGFALTHLYGLTETYGPATLNEWHSAWDNLPKADKDALRARQGVRYPALEQLTVMDPATMTQVPADGETVGEIMFRGNIVMKGYLKNPEATAEAFEGGWFHSGDLAVLHPDGYIQIKDRSKDVIISGGENISSIEVEDVLFKHPAVAICAVVAKPDEKWGETPCAFVELKPDAAVTEAELIALCREQLAHFKAPRRIVFTEIPKTSTGKVQKFKLREIGEDRLTERELTNVTLTIPEGRRRPSIRAWGRVDPLELIARKFQPVEATSLKSARNDVAISGIEAGTCDYGSLRTAASQLLERPLMPGDFQPENFVFEFEFFLFETADREVVGSWAERLLFNPTLELPMLF